MTKAKAGPRVTIPEASERDAERNMDKGRPRDAQVYATLAVSARLEAVSCAIQQLDE